MKLLILTIIALTFSQVDSLENCTSTIPKHYEELNCVPQMLDENRCPRTFNCSSFEGRDRSKCHFNGKTFNVLEEVQSAEILESCNVNCVCRRDHDSDAARFHCLHIDCPEFFHDEVATDDCISQYERNSCCMKQRVCGDDIKKLSTCEFNGKTYFDGQQIDTGNACYSCLCGSGFEDKPVEQNKHCKKINCLIDLHYSSKFYDGCVPIYYKKENCCPIDFRCPSAETKIERGKTNETAAKIAGEEGQMRCLFGDLSLAIGDSLSPENDDDCIACTCNLPPHPTCIKTC